MQAKDQLDQHVKYTSVMCEDQTVVIPPTYTNRDYKLRHVPTRYEL